MYDIRYMIYVGGLRLFFWKFVVFGVFWFFWLGVSYISGLEVGLLGSGFVYTGVLGFLFEILGDAYAFVVVLIRVVIMEGIRV